MKPNRALTRSELILKHERLRDTVRAALDVYDRYCAHDPSVDDYDIGRALEKLRQVMRAEIECRYDTRNP